SIRASACASLSTLPLHDALPILSLMEHWRRATFILGAAMIWLAVVRRTCDSHRVGVFAVRSRRFDMSFSVAIGAALVWLSASVEDRKSTRLNSSHVSISYAVFCL